MYVRVKRPGILSGESKLTPCDCHRAVNDKLELWSHEESFRMRVRGLCPYTGRFEARSSIDLLIGDLATVVAGTGSDTLRGEQTCGQ
ncbi:hypothetical protein M8818_006055 [Zalaria obscura]|uniref:Uncharacterized protein n=1 Tax=Zalaria obscura TaxID=2024903 RepID=A0ACC3S7T5_9PEZI